MPPPEIQTNIARVADALVQGELVVFLGAGANLCDRPDPWKWERQQREHLPSAIELSRHLVDRFHMRDWFPERDPKNTDSKDLDLARVAQAVVLEMGTAALKGELHTLLNADYPLTPLHCLLAGLPARLRAAALPRSVDNLSRRLLIVSTNYDDLLERAFADAGQPFHTLRYHANRPRLGRFLYRSPAGGAEVPVRNPKLSAREMDGDEYPILMKFHGSVDRENRDSDSFVITEEDYVEYLAQTASPELIPTPAPAMLKRSHVLFLGHALRDWNLRVILYRLWEERDDRRRWWAIQRQPDQFERKFWGSKEVDIFDYPLNGYIELLDQQLRTLGV